MFVTFVIFHLVCDFEIAHQANVCFSSNFYFALIILLLDKPTDGPPCRISG
jgi:hypothetical protein